MRSDVPITRGDFDAEDDEKGINGDEDC